MIPLVQEIRNRIVFDGDIAVWSLGQAGFVYKLPSGKIVLIDPYITNYCERQIGADFKRLVPSLISPEELNNLWITAYLITHHHEDHLDVDCISRLQSRSFSFYAPPETISHLTKLGIEGDRCYSLADGSKYIQDDLTIHGVFADHGELAPDAVGIIIEAEGKTIYHMGDTSLDEDSLRRIAQSFRVDLLIAPINGRYGNMNETDAARAVVIINPKYASPCHFWTLPGNSGGDPLIFMRAVKESHPQTQTFLFRVGELLII